MTPQEQKTPPQKQGDPENKTYLQALKKSSLSFVAIAPILLGVLGLIGLIQVYVTPGMLASFFTGNPITDAFIGMVAASAASGNPINSYVLGGEFLEKGVSLYAVTAFILSWVTLGFTHLPAEVEMFGLKFTAWRNGLTVLATLLVACATALTMKVLV